MREATAEANGPTVALEADGRWVTLKWHCLRRRSAHQAFSRANLEAGLAAGAVVEVDLVATADGEFVCLHDLTLDGETTGQGPVAVQPSAAVLALRQRDSTGRPTDSRVMSLDEIVEMLRSNPPVGPPDGRLQLDLKEPLAGITFEVCRRFSSTLDDFGGWFTLSGPSWPAIERLAAGVPDLATGFDPENAIAAGMARPLLADLLAARAFEFALERAIFLTELAGQLGKGPQPLPAGELTG